MAHFSKSGNNKGRRITPLTDEDIVHEYFRLIKAKDMYRLLDLFTDDAVIYEPFSRLEDGEGVDPNCERHIGQIGKSGESPCWGVPASVGGERLLSLRQTKLPSDKTLLRRQVEAGRGTGLPHAPLLGWGLLQEPV